PSRRLRGIKNRSRTASPRKPACPTGARYAVYANLDSLNDMGIPAENDHNRGEFSSFCRIWAPNRASRPGHAGQPGRLDPKADRSGSVADVESAQPIAVRRKHASGHIAAAVGIDGGAEIADVEAAEVMKAAPGMGGSGG